MVLHPSLFILQTLCCLLRYTWRQGTSVPKSSHPGDRRSIHENLLCPLLLDLLQVQPGAPSAPGLFLATNPIHNQITASYKCCSLERQNVPSSETSTWLSLYVRSPEPARGTQTCWRSMVKVWLPRLFFGFVALVTLALGPLVTQVSQMSNRD